MSAPDADAAVELVRQAIQDAEAAGERPPGRPTLVRLTGLTEHAVKVAQAAIREESEDAGAGVSPAISSAPPAVDEVSPAGPGAEEMPGAEDHEPVVAGPAGDPLEALDIQPPLVGYPALQPAAPVLQSAPPARRHRPWPLLLIGLGAAVAVWSGWVELGKMAGFGVVQLLPGVVDGLRLNSAIVLPLSMEAYAAYALRCWLGSNGLSERTVNFARRSAISSLVIGALAQVAYHLMAAAGLPRAPWWITMLVACVPVVVLGLASALARLVTSDLQSPSAGGDR